MAAIASLALAPSGPPPWAMSGRPPPPCPPSAAVADLINVPAAKRPVRSSVTPMATVPLPSSPLSTMTTTPDPMRPGEFLVHRLETGEWVERAPFHEAVAVSGEGVFDTLKAVSKLVLKSLA